MKYIYILQQALGWIIVIYWLYQLIISACALIQFKEKPLIKNKKHKFMMILPAHNESSVIGALIESLQSLDPTGPWKVFSKFIKSKGEKYLDITIDKEDLPKVKKMIKKIK